MFRRSLAAVAVMLIVSGVVLAETVRGICTSASDTEIKVTVRKKGEKEGKEMTYKVNKDTKVLVSQGKDKDAKDSSIGKLTEAVKKGADTKLKGAFVTVEEKDGTATSITHGGGGKKKKE